MTPGRGVGRGGGRRLGKNMLDTRYRLLRDLRGLRRCVRLAWVRVGRVGVRAGVRVVRARARVGEGEGEGGALQEVVPLAGGVRVVAVVRVRVPSVGSLASPYVSRALG